MHRIQDGVDPAYPWNRERPFNDFPGFLIGLFGQRVQKLSVDAGFTCPNRDGTKGTGGCTFCDNDTFNPLYCSPDLSVIEQLEKGIAFFDRKYPGQNYFAYFQAYTNTYSNINHLIALYEEALSHPRIVGLVVGTRPDCITGELIDYFEELSAKYYVSLEFGIESVYNRTLERINRGHTYEDSVQAVNQCRGRGFLVGAHLIFGLPGESDEDILAGAGLISQLPLNLLKIHQLQVIRGTALERDFAANPADFRFFTVDQYIDLIIRFLERLNPGFVIERFVNVSPPGRITGRRWGLKNHELVARIEKEMRDRKTWQGRLYDES
ncbi:MAG: TIGR01212 family radical SAM protein [Bacteroidales bacterium]